MKIAQAVTEWASAIVASTVVAVALTGMTAGAQGGAPARGGQPVISFKSAVEMVTVSASVRDDRGRLVRGLKQSDFEVLDAGQPVMIRDFYTGDSPISLAILLDISGSMTVGGNMTRAREAVGVAMTSLRQGSDEASLFTFDSILREVVPFTTDLDRVRRVSLEGRPWGTTLLYDAIADTARALEVRPNRHRAVLVVTDGVDSGSRMTAPDVSGIASSIDVPVYLLTVVTPVDHPGGEFSLIERDSKATTQTATLAELARWTGGDMRVASEPDHTLTAIRDLFAELRQQYVITFEPGALPGWHPLEIRTRKKDQVVHARSGYFSGPARNGRSN